MAALAGAVGRRVVLFECFLEQVLVGSAGVADGGLDVLQGPAESVVHRGFGEVVAGEHTGVDELAVVEAELTEQAAQVKNRGTLALLQAAQNQGRAAHDCVVVVRDDDVDVALSGEPGTGHFGLLVGDEILDPGLCEDALQVVEKFSIDRILFAEEPHFLGADRVELHEQRGDGSGWRALEDGEKSGFLVDGEGDPAVYFLGVSIALVAALAQRICLGDERHAVENKDVLYGGVREFPGKVQEAVHVLQGIVHVLGEAVHENPGVDRDA